MKTTTILLTCWVLCLPLGAEGTPEPLVSKNGMEIWVEDVQLDGTVLTFRKMGGGTRIMISESSVDWTATRKARNRAGLSELENAESPGTISFMTGPEPVLYPETYSEPYLYDEPTWEEPSRIEVVYVEAAPSYSPEYDPYWDSGWGHRRPERIRIPPVTSHTSRSSGITYAPEHSPHNDRSTARFNRSWQK